MSSIFVLCIDRGVYLSCALYTPDDKVVVTSDDVIPTVEVDEGTPANISQDFHWFLKVPTTAYSFLVESNLWRKIEKRKRENKQSIGFFRSILNHLWEVFFDVYLRQDIWTNNQ